MELEEDKWAKGFRDRLEDYSEPVPAGIWDSLEKELSGTVVKQVHPYRKLAVAAAVLLALISSVSLLFLHTPQAEYVREAKTNIPISEPSKISGPILPHKEVELTAKVKSRVPINQIGSILFPVENEGIEVVVRETLPESVATPQDEPVVEDKKEGGTSRRELVARRTGSVHSGPGSFRPLMKPNLKNENNWSVGVSVGNAPLSANSGLAGFGDLSADMEGRDADPFSISELMSDDQSQAENQLARAAFRQVLINNINKATYTDVKHRMPFTVGVAFRFELSHGFSVETGVNYTLLSSELRSGNESDYYSKQQRLHYIGIPLKGNWKFLDKKNFSLYLSAGGTIEKCVSGILKSDYVTENKMIVREDERRRVKPLQWSVSSAVGAQYNATRHVGLFVEPGIVYFFDDGSPVETIRKEKPFNFNLQMGLRFTY